MIPDPAPMVVLCFVAGRVDGHFGQEKIVPDCFAAGVSGTIHRG